MQFDNRYATLSSKLFHRQSINSLPDVQGGHFNPVLAQQLQWSVAEQDDWINIINGNTQLKGSDPLAMVYAGHQFGQWAGQLGDGRGLLLGQIRDVSGKLIDLHIKGAGLTPYSRMGDGRAVLRSVIREYLAGHALQHLHVPSSNAIGFVYSHALQIQREHKEPAAMLLRTSDCHIRLGHFEWINQYQPELLTEFTTHCIQNYYPQCLQHAEPVLAFAGQVIDRTAYMIAQWQLTGFAHGVMNTDNFNITGSTLDFGPYGFMERFRPNWINNHSDGQGRYTYQNQPSIAHWNLWIWLNNLIPLAKSEQKEAFKQELAKQLEQYEQNFLHYYSSGLCKKMGLPVDNEQSFQCGLQFLKILQAEQLDYTTSFRQLSSHQYTAIRDQCLDIRTFDDFLTTYHQLRENQQQSILDMDMQQHNPIYILRNHMAQRAIERAEQGDLSEVDRLFKLLSQPYTKQADLEITEDLAPLSNDVPDVMVSCSS
ncbi:YdiU family protein [Acinetobacter qingfengensis]|uniref:Protein nucleotidyltransferase YdiU n=1 Tax=Acinetobacter qingfengensis TaxID=1262585 RepID=A0A1E7QXH4_9GAMM|nr:YdiU family protein [Acinetobacter qingfengensis]KAA8731650.1 YdiU family protein [Acinetobacter qingfengensis]OEY91753.1 selenoprotein O and cysteine-containing protein [Acinetobacter qingfengensis]